MTRPNDVTKLASALPVVVAAVLAGAAVGGASGCGGDTSCQSGAKYGTQCYALSDIRNSPGHGAQSPMEPLSPITQPIGPMPFGGTSKGGASPPAAPSPTAPFMTFRVHDAGVD